MTDDEATPTGLDEVAGLSVSTEDADDDDPRLLHRCSAARSVGRFDYPEKDPEVVGSADPAVIGPAASLFEHGERAGNHPPMNVPRS